MERREFVKKACLMCGGAFLVSELASSCSKKSNTNNPSAFSGSFTLDLSSSSNASLKSAGGYVYSNNVIVMNVSGSYIALSSVCTHQGCSVNYNKSNNRVECPCHSGVFDTNGNVVAGPPPSSLKKYNVSITGNTLTVSS